MSPPRTVLLDNEAVQALASRSHRKHRRMLAIVQESASRRVRKATSIRLVVPTAVRVEAGCDRRSSEAATLNRLRIDDDDLDRAAGDAAAKIRTSLGVSVADAHLAACLETTAGPHAIVTSDVDDARRIAAHLDATVNVVMI